MEIVIAKTAGFCFGVKRAVQTCYDQAETGSGPIYTYGPIIHNEQVVEDLEMRGVHVLHDADELSRLTEGTVIIRSHGVEKAVYDQIEGQGLKLVDATCPFVRKIHRIVREHSENGEDIIIIGNPEHPEVQGIMGWAAGIKEDQQTEKNSDTNHPAISLRVIESEEQALAAVQEDACLTEEQAAQCRRGRTVCIVSQTTFNYNKFNKLVEILHDMRYDKSVILNTICNATEERQSEARSLSRKADAMIVIGGRHSSNTQKLFEICNKECDNTIYIQSPVDLDFRRLPTSGCLGITAGASTPNILIEEVSKQCQK